MNATMYERIKQTTSASLIWGLMSAGTLILGATTAESKCDLDEFLTTGKSCKELLDAPQNERPEKPAESSSPRSILNAEQTLSWINNKLQENQRTRRPASDEFWSVHGEKSWEYGVDLAPGKLIVRESYHAPSSTLRSPQSGNPLLRNPSRDIDRTYEAYIADLATPTSSVSTTDGTLKISCKRGRRCISVEKFHSIHGESHETRETIYLTLPPDTRLLEKLEKAFKHLFEMAPGVRDNEPF